MNALFENLFDEDAVCAGSVSREDFLLVVAGAKVKFPRSLLSMYRVVPRTMSRYELALVQSETVTGVVFTTVYNVRRNLGLEEREALSLPALEKYYLDKANDVLTLMVNNTNLEHIAAYRMRSRRLLNPVVFRAGAVPLALVFTSRKKLSIYREDTSQAAEDSTYTKIAANVALAGKYAGLLLLDVHTPGTALMLTAVYGLDDRRELRKLADSTALENHQQSGALSEAMKLSDFRAVFEGLKKSVPLTNLEMINE
ncbi:MC073R [Molluscum contagiosum virus subtype 1]|uniref:Core protein VP8 n=4 Tax=Molluscum contagiosum virus TaxID=10279 RepID=A0A7G5AX74_MCV1|nr:MC073R [Molluscum contagiosum virus subtype 1]AAB49661.1 similar to Vaccinia virus F5 (L4R) polypeptide, Swiss-Prot Accession Number P03295 [Molluscum contagiosum virus]AAC55201.1 MC073R [Molluscum contagiosum virus subtype 1]AQY16822.1 MC073 [Molluscum contagiosum virus subtype 1]AQY17001.1 MC073 [Molluscum contagiosum virus subtype 1]AQY17180.1 MC073 [Molluscum contagiosum virus subtype 1]